MGFESWAKIKIAELESTCLAYTWRSQQERDTKRLKMISREMCNDIETQHLFSKMSKKISLVFHREITNQWDNGETIQISTRNKWDGLVSIKAGVWKDYISEKSDYVQTRDETHIT